MNSPGGSEPDIVIRDVTLRDGLQNELPIPTQRKIELYQALRAAGIRELELTSFVRSDRVPSMADAEHVFAATASDTHALIRWALVLNRAGARRALNAGATHLQFVFSVSEPHNLRNAGRTSAESLTELAQIVAMAGAQDATVEATLATAFGCPFTGAVAPVQVERAVEGALDAGVAGIGLADTIGTGVPTEVAAVTAATVARTGNIPVGVHLHDTRGLAIANGLAALEAGARRLDGSVGGLGGCPFAPGASGNVPLEDLVHALEGMGIRTGIDLDRLLDASRLACALVDRPIGSHIGIAGPRFRRANA